MLCEWSIVKHVAWALWLLFAHLVSLLGSIYLYIHAEREGEREREKEGEGETHTQEYIYKTSVLIICPPDFPAMIPLWCIPVATMTGNTLVIKPSHVIEQGV